jgi:hypothetical protein
MPAMKTRLFPLLLLAGALTLHGQDAWRDRMALPLMGKHNWIVIADPAYPLPSSTGIEVAATQLSQTDLLAAVLKALTGAHHLRPVFYTDSELPYVPEEDANGIGSYRAQLATLLGGGDVTSLPQDQIEAKMETASLRYHVLVLKSTTLLPYTAVYIELDSGYWNADAERRLRAAMQGK